MIKIYDDYGNEFRLLATRAVDQIPQTLSGVIRLGCHTFGRKNSTILRRWALAK